MNAIPAELQSKLSIYSKDLAALRTNVQKLNSQIKSFDYEYKSNALSLKELANISSDGIPRCYKNVGKMFVEDNLVDCRKEIEDANSVIQSSLHELSKKRKEADEQLKRKEEEFVHFLSENNLVLKPIPQN